MSQLVEDVMTQSPIALFESATAEEATLAMREADVGAVLVLREDDGAVCGILTDRDIVVRLVANRRDPVMTCIGEICSAHLTKIRPDEPIEVAVDLMRDNTVRRLPVVAVGRAVGVVSLGDLACCSRSPVCTCGYQCRARQYLTTSAPRCLTLTEERSCRPGKRSSTA